MTIWDDPWIAVATASFNGSAGPWNTTLPPPPPQLTQGEQFLCVRWRDISGSLTEEWIDLVGTRWSPTEIAERLTDAWIPLLFDRDGVLRATCVLRPPCVGSNNLWLLETLRARPGWASRLMRCLMTWIWQKEGGGGPFSLGFTWELTVAQLAVAWWRGWLAAAKAIEFGWTWSVQATDGGCSFCPKKESWHGPPPVFAVPTLLQQPRGWAIMNDSGLRDGWGHVVAFGGEEIDWSAVAAAGGWRSLWVRALEAPSPKWRPTGEIVVVGVLNLRGPVYFPWITAEI